MTHSVHKVKRTKPQAPISSHRLFPAMVALWFAALFGIGSIILPASLFDALETPAASGWPGANAKLVIALVATIAGAALGLALARKVAGGQQPEPARRREFVTPAQPSALDRVSEPRKPICVEDLGERLDSPEGDNGQRRRSLAMEEPEGPSDWFHPNLPFSGTVGEFDGESSGVDTNASSLMEPLDLADFATQDAHEPEIFEPAIDEPAVRQREAQPVLAEMPAALAWPEENVSYQPQDFADNAHEAGAIPLEDRDLSELGLSDLTQRLNRAIRIRAEQEAEQARSRAPFASATPPIADDGGLQSFFASPASDAVPPAAPAELTAEPAMASEDEYRPALAMSSSERGIPKAMRPVNLDDIEEFPEEDLIAPRMAFAPTGHGETRQMFGSPVAFSETVESVDEAEEELAGENHGSLADLGNPFKLGAEFVRIEEPEAEDDSVEPAVIFPGQEARRSFVQPFDMAPAPAAEMAVRPQGMGFQRKGDSKPATMETQAEKSAASLAIPAQAADPAETERALRLALATLQRMSGAA